MTAQLFWRVSGRLPRSLGIFVHFSGPGNKFKHADHELIGGTYFLKRAPRHILLRDSFAIRLDPQADAGEWTMRVGLWHASGDGSRVRAFTSDGQRAQEDRLEVVRFTVGSPGTGPSP